MSVQKIIGYSERPRLIHLCRGAIEQAGSAIRKLSVSGQSQKGQNQYEGYAFDGAKIVIISRIQSPSITPLTLYIRNLNADILYSCLYFQLSESIRLTLFKRNFHTLSSLSLGSPMNI